MPLGHSIQLCYALPWVILGINDKPFKPFTFRVKLNLVYQWTAGMIMSARSKTRREHIARLKKVLGSNYSPGVTIGNRSI